MLNSKHASSDAALWVSGYRRFSLLLWRALLVGEKNERAIKKPTNLKTAVIRILLFVFLFVQKHIVAACFSLQRPQSLYGTLNFKATGGAQEPHFKDGLDEMQQYLCNTNPGSLNASCSIHPAKVQLGKIRRHRARSCYHLSLKFVFSNVFYANLGTTIYSEDVIIIIQKPLSKSRFPLLASVVWRCSLKRDFQPCQPSDSLSCKDTSHY